MIYFGDEQGRFHSINGVKMANYTCVTVVFLMIWCL